MSEEAPADPWGDTVHGKPAVGDVAERAKRTSLRDIELFRAITGDRNPLHYDRARAEATVFGKLIVQGGVVSGLLDAIVAEDLPGPGTVLIGVEWQFTKAVGVDEKIVGRVEVLEVRNDQPICRVKTTVLDGDGEVCLDGQATTYTVPLPA